MSDGTAARLLTDPAEARTMIIVRASGLLAARVEC
jgi:hypothetical protein